MQEFMGCLFGFPFVAGIATESANISNTLQP
jgi:hypothetical protein